MMSQMNLRPWIYHHRLLLSSQRKSLESLSKKESLTCLIIIDDRWAVIASLVFMMSAGKGTVKTRIGQDSLSGFY